MNLNLAQGFKIVDATAGAVTTNGGVAASDTVTLKNAVRAWILLQFTQAVGHATVISVRQASVVANTATAAGPTCRIWANEDTAASDTLVEQTAGATYTLTADVKKKQVLIEVDPAALTEGYPCLYFTVSDSSQATNFVAGQFILQQRYTQASPFSAIVD